jgi:hypothetical protein
MKNGRRPDLMQMGWRALALLRVMRPQEVRGMNVRIPPAAISQIRQIFGKNDPLATGLLFRRVLAWVRRCVSLTQLGQRFYSMAAVMRNDLVDGITCEEIGAFKNSTRQAANKPLQEFSDTFSGIKNLPMRGVETRKKCKRSQIAKLETV